MFTDWTDWNPVLSQVNLVRIFAAYLTSILVLFCDPLLQVVSSI